MHTIQWRRKRGGSRGWRPPIFLALSVVIVLVLRFRPKGKDCRDGILINAHHVHQLEYWPRVACQSVLRMAGSQTSMVLVR